MLMTLAVLVDYYTDSYHCAPEKQVLDSALSAAQLCRVGAMAFAFGGPSCMGFRTLSCAYGL